MYIIYMYIIYIGIYYIYVYIIYMYRQAMPMAMSDSLRVIHDSSLLTGRDLRGNTWNNAAGGRVDPVSSLCAREPHLQRGDQQP